ncbi:type II toxin-antitoxin system RelE/ParE family toxin [Endozoicomonas sp. 2B-B]
MAIQTFLHKGLEDYFYDGTTKGITPKHKNRIARLLDILDQAKKPHDMRIPGFNFHKLEPKTAGRYSVHVNGPWCITFEFEGQDAIRVDYEQYH